MHTIVRRLRAVLSLAALWGLLTGAMGLAIGLGISVHRSQYALPRRLAWWWAESHEFVTGFAIAWAIAGALIAVGFAGLVASGERRRTTQELSPSRFARWGALAGTAVYVAWWVGKTEAHGRPPTSVALAVLSLLTSIGIGAGAAWLTLRAARHSGLEPPPDAFGRRQPPDLLPAGALEHVPPPAKSRTGVT